MKQIDFDPKSTEYQCIVGNLNGGGYEAPLVFVHEILVESGFASSLNITPVDDSNEPQLKPVDDWDDWD